MGTAAEYIALDVDLVTELPDHVSFAEGATLGIPCMTAHGCVFAAGSVQGKTLLVTGGAGAVGHYAVQLAAWAGAEVIATVSSPEKAARAQAGGAAHVVNYRSENVADRVREITRGVGVDHVVDVDLGGNLAATLGSVRDERQHRLLRHQRGAEAGDRSAGTDGEEPDRSRLRAADQSAPRRESGRSPTLRHSFARRAVCCRLRLSFRCTKPPPRMALLRPAVSSAPLLWPARGSKEVAEFYPFGGQRCSREPPLGNRAG